MKTIVNIKSQIYGIIDEKKVSGCSYPHIIHMLNCLICRNNLVCFKTNSNYTKMVKFRKLLIKRNIDHFHKKLALIIMKVLEFTRYFNKCINVFEC